jgi:hypothetical protein
MLSPFPITGRLVVDARQEVEIVKRHLLLLDAQLMVQLPLSGILDARDGVWQVGARFCRHAQRVRAACVRPHVWECNLFRRPLLKKQLVLVVEQENGEGPVQQPLVDIGHQVA